jgi:hypothetical protein
MGYMGVCVGGVGVYGLCGGVGRVCREAWGPRGGGSTGGMGEKSALMGVRDIFLQVLVVCDAMNVGCQRAAWHWLTRIPSSRGVSLFYPRPPRSHLPSLLYRLSPAHPRLVSSLTLVSVSQHACVL